MSGRSEMPTADCDLGGVNDNVNENLEKLSGLLRGRDGWRLETQDGGEDRARGETWVATRGRTR